MEEMGLLTENMEEEDLMIDERAEYEARQKELNEEIHLPVLFPKELREKYLLTKTFENFDPYNDELKVNLKKCKDFVYGNEKTLMLVGYNGTGKSHLGIATMNKMPKRKGLGYHNRGFNYTVYRPTKCMYHNFTDFNDILTDAQKDGKKNYVMKARINYDVVFIDDVKLEYIEGNRSAIKNLYMIVETIYTAPKSRVIVAMNFSLEELWKIDNAIADRLREDDVECVFTSESWRKIGKKIKGNNK